MCELTAKELGCQPDDVLVCSTGLIGIELDPVPLRTGIPAVAAARRPGGGADAAEAIRTTDTRRKEVLVVADGFTVGGMAKGAAMLAPNMATMLAVLTTDADVEGPVLQDALAAAVAGSFNRLSVDGCTSTNDTVIVLASGLQPAAPDAVAGALAQACGSLARQMAADAEGHTKVVTVRVTGAANDAEADQAARKVADSQLVKCSWYGRDPYWGRVLSELGTAGVALDLDAVTISYGDVVVSVGGLPVPHDADALLAVMAAEDLTVECDLGVGGGEGWVLTNDLTHAYIDENMGTS
jgi:glutamate N-acetyltransferase/amino-acid N-acetyltransferase